MCFGVVDAFDLYNGKVIVELLTLDRFVLVGEFEQRGFGGFFGVPDCRESVDTGGSLGKVAIDYCLDGVVWERE